MDKPGERRLGEHADVGRCAAPAFCAAVDDHGHALTFDGTTWTSPVAIDAGHALDAVRCTTSTFCAAVDDHGHALTFDGTTWTSPDSIDFTDVLEAVSCPTADFCPAVDAVGDALTFPPPVAITTTMLPAGRAHDPYSDSLAASGRQSSLQMVGQVAPGAADQPVDRGDLRDT